MLRPFTVLKIESKSADLVSHKSKVVHKVNVDHVCKYIEPAPRIPGKWPPDSPSTRSTSEKELSPPQPKSAFPVPCMFETEGTDVQLDTLEAGNYGQIFCDEVYCCN